ncbi:hypothetical protein [Nocardioides montaniterrae]
MYARSSTYQGDPMTLDAGIAFVRDGIMPALSELPQCLGMSFMVDRTSGMCIATTSWRFAEDMRQSRQDLVPLRERLGKVLGSPPVVEEWEMAAMHRAPSMPTSSCCRVTWLRTDHADVDRGIDVFRMGVMPHLEQMQGFCSASLMLDRTRSRACVTVGFDSTENMERSADQAWAIRDAGVRDAGVDVVDGGEFELAMAHLRIPEMA